MQTPLAVNHPTAEAAAPVHTYLIGWYTIQQLKQQPQSTHTTSDGTIQQLKQQPQSTHTTSDVCQQQQLLEVILNHQKQLQDRIHELTQSVTMLEEKNRESRRELEAQHQQQNRTGIYMYTKHVV